MKQQSGLSPETAMGHLGDDKRQFLGAVVPPVFLNSLNVFPTAEAYLGFDAADPGDAFLYGRTGNPTTALAEEKIAALEGAEDAALFSSGMAALSSAVLSCVKAGDHVIGIRTLYGPLYTLLTSWLPRFGVTATFVAGTDLSEIERAIQPNTALICLESPSSLVFSLQDLRGVATLARARGIRTMIDNSWATPLYQKPIAMGIDIVCHTCSKYLGGHSDIIAGVVCSDAETIRGLRLRERELLGGVLGPAEAALLVRSLRTLAVRMPRHMESGLTVARWLAQQPHVKRVLHPGLDSHPQHALAKVQMTGYGSVFGAELDLPLEDTLAFINASGLFQIGCSWGGYESLCLPVMAKASDEACLAFGVSRSYVRFAVGLEDPQDLIDDLAQAFAQVGEK